MCELGLGDKEVVGQRTEGRKKVGRKGGKEGRREGGKMGRKVYLPIFIFL